MGTRLERLVLVLPLVLLLSILLIGPAAFGFLATFTDYTPTQALVHWTGAGNYLAVLGDSEFSTALWNIAPFALIAVPAELAIGLLVALLLRKPFPGRGLVRMLLLAPWLLSPAANGVMWHFLYDSQRGLSSFIFSWLGTPAWPSPLGLPDLALPAAILTDIWRKAPFAAFLLLPGLLTIPNEQWEQAEISGASPVARLRDIVLPWLRVLLLTVGLLLLGDTLGTFDNILVLTGGGPGSRTIVPGLYSYRQAITNSDWPTGSTAAWLIGILMLLVGVVYLRLVHSSPRAETPGRANNEEQKVDMAAALPATPNGAALPRRGSLRLGWRTSRILAGAVRTLLLALLLAAFIVPILWTILASFNIEPVNSNSPPTWQTAASLENYVEVGTTEPGFSDELLTTFVLGITTTLLTMAIGFLAAYSLVRSSFRSKGIVLSSLLVVASLPAMAYIIPQRALLNAIGLYDTMAGVALGEAAAFVPLAVYVLYGYLVDVSPELEEAARLEGAKVWHLLRSIVLPASWSGVAATGVIVFVLAWNQVLIPLVLSTNHVRGVPLAMVDFFKFDRELEWSSVAAAFVSSLVPLFLLVLIAHPLLERFTLTRTAE